MKDFFRNLVSTDVRKTKKQEKEKEPKRENCKRRAYMHTNTQPQLINYKMQKEQKKKRKQGAN